MLVVLSSHSCYSSLFIVTHLPVRIGDDIVGYFCNFFRGTMVGRFADFCKIDFLTIHISVLRIVILNANSSIVLLQ